MHFSSVVLPEPLCPIRPIEDPSSIANETSRSAQKSSAFERVTSSRCFTEVGRSLNSLNDFETPSTSIACGHSSSAKSPDMRKKRRQVKNSSAAETTSTIAEHAGVPGDAHVRQHLHAVLRRWPVEGALEPEHDRRQRVQQVEVPQARRCRGS